MTERPKYRECDESRRDKRPKDKNPLRILIPPLVSLSLILSPVVDALKKPKEAPPPAKSIVLESGWSMGKCRFDEKEWSMTYESSVEIGGEEQVTVKLDKIEGVGSPEKIICGDVYSYIITPTHVLITLGGMRVFADHPILGIVGDELVDANVMGLDITPISKEGILMNLVVDDKLYAFTRIGKLWEIPLKASSKASCAFTSKYPPMGKMAITTYKGLVVLIKDGDENVVLVESGKDKFVTLTSESEEWVKGKILVKEEEDCMRVKIGQKEYVIKVAEEGDIKTAAIEEHVYKEEDESKIGE